ncbi:MAG: hypothetical protein LBM93_05810, partial [Oscillospiraceae bacterium]|nr:hypothetical protein [Oscillospiraceae bacterium]
MIDNAYYYDIETKSPVRINADKASEQYSRGISSKPERNDDNRPSPYICEFCGEYLTLTKKVKKQRPHFNHYTEKDCEGKALQNNYNYKKNNPLGISLPLKIDITNNKISVSVGFRPLSNEQYDNAQKADLEVYIEEQKYNIANRISCDYTTYLPIGSNIREEYSIKFNDENCIPKEIWGRTVLGIKPSGTLFTYKNDGCEEKRLNRNATVYLNTEYLLLTKKFPTSNLIIQRKPSINDWNIYVVSAKSFTEETWLFFLSYGVNLTEKTAELIPIYPLSIRSASFVTHFSEKIWLYKTHGECEIYPNKRNFSNESRFISIPKSNLHQIVSISQKSNHTNVLKYLYIQH